MQSYPVLTNIEQKSLFDALEISAWIINENYLVEFASRDILRILDMSLDSVIGKSCFQLAGRDNPCDGCIIKEMQVCSDSKPKHTIVLINNREYSMECIRLNSERPRFLVTVKEYRNNPQINMPANKSNMLNEYGVFLKLFKESPVAQALLKLSDEENHTLTTYNDEFRKLFGMVGNCLFSEVFTDLPPNWAEMNLQRIEHHGYVKYENYYHKIKNRYYHLCFTYISTNLFLFSVIDSTENMESQRQIVNTLYDKIEKERERFARDLHDGLGSLLSSVAMRINVLKSGKLSAEKSMNTLELTSELINMAIGTTREIAHNIKPFELNEGDFRIAVISFLDKVCKAGEIDIRYNRDDLDIKLNEDEEINLYRVLCELINNTLKHARASMVRIKFKQVENRIFFEYHDNGNGFDVQNSKNRETDGIGLKNIFFRSTELGGAFRFDSEKGHGMTFKLVFDRKQ